MEYQTLNNGLKMPIVGFGVFRVPDKKECEESVYQAIKAGYRLIDTAASYTNEDAVGAGVKRAIEEGVCTRKDLFITSKMWVQDMKNYETAKKAIETMKYYDVIPEAWAPLGGGRYKPFEDEMLKGIAAKYNKSVGQVLLRWNVQRGVVVPKSTHVERIKENIDIFDFELNEEEMKQISSLNMGYSGSRAKHFDVEFVEMCLAKKIHD